MCDRAIIKLTVSIDSVCVCVTSVHYLGHRCGEFRRVTHCYHSD